MFQFEKTPGGYYRCFDQSGTLYESESIGIIYDLSDPPILATLHQIGKSDLVQDLYLERFAPKNAEFPEVFDFKFIQSNQWEVEDLNKFMSNTGYLGMWLKRNEMLNEMKGA